MKPGMGQDIEAELSRGTAGVLSIISLIPVSCETQEEPKPARDSRRCWSKDTPQTQARREALIARNKARKWTAQMRAQAAESKKGDRNPRWKGDAASERAKKKRS